MFLFIVKRLLYMIPILLGVTLITFILFNVVGGNPAYQHAGKNASAETIRELEAELGIDRPLPDQYLFYLNQIATFDYGRSWATRQAISTMILDGIGASLCLTFPPFVISILLSISIALWTARKRGTMWDRGMLIFCLAGMSISSLVYIIFGQYVLAYLLGWFPISGWETGWVERWQYLFLPWIIWIVVSIGSSILFYRTLFIEEMFQDYVRTARAKGLDDNTVYFTHILKNAMIPIITLVVMELPSLLAGSLLLEAFFAIPGIGGLLIKALQGSDFPVIKAMTFIGTVLYISANILSDICYALVDPRIKLK
ncbi:MAG: ABC transporter permease [Bdellovibrionia bacterium]